MALPLPCILLHETAIAMNDPGACAGSKGSVRIKEAAVVALPGAMRGGLNSLFRASQTFNTQNIKSSSLGKLSSLGSLGR